MTQVVPTCNDERPRRRLRCCKNATVTMVLSFNAGPQGYIANLNLGV